MYFETTEGTSIIKRIYKYKSCEKVCHVIIFYRVDKDDYGIALNYNTDNGTWVKGIYNFKSQEEAEKYLKKIKKII